MYKYSGVILDRDDDAGATLKSVFPTIEDVPDLIKSASIQPHAELPDQAFALVALDGDHILRKYACHDAGNTALSVIYFMEHAEKLPEEAVKTAAAHLFSACMEHGLVPPEGLSKLAKFYWGKAPLKGVKGGTYFPTIRRAGRAAKGAVKKQTGAAAQHVGREFAKGVEQTAKKSVKQNKKAIHEAVKEVAEEAGKAGAKGVEEQQKGKGWDLAKKIIGASVLAGGGATAGVAATKKLTRAGEAAVEKTQEAIGMSEKPKVRKPKSNMVDIKGKKRMPKVKAAAAAPQDYMWEDPFTGQRLFPINSWDLIKHAENYLLQEGIRLKPEVRRSCAVKLAAKADQIGYPLDGTIKEAGATTYASAGHIQANLEIRKMAAGQEEFLDELFEKRASMGPDMFAEVLRRFDVDAGIDRWWGSEIPDPWESTCGLAKEAGVVWEEGLDRLTDADLKNLVENHSSGLYRLFSDEIQEGFIRDPIGVFNSMPLPQKRIIARLAHNMAHSGGSEGTPQS